MNSRVFPADGRRVSEVGLGCWQLGAEWGEVSDDAADGILRAAVDEGVTFFDTADVYGRGRSEQLVARTLAGLGRQDRDRCFVATKVGRMPDPGFPANFGYDVMRRHVEDSCRRLKVDQLDLVQLHCVPPEVLERGEVFDHLRRCRDDGLLKHWGASVESSAEAHRCLQEPDCASLQLICNVLRQTPVVGGLLARCQEQGVAVVVRLPLASGLLSGRMDAGRQFGADDHRSFNRQGEAFHVGETFAGLPFERGLELVERVRAVCAAGGRPTDGSGLAMLSLRWILDHKAVTTVIPGATRRQQVRENSRAGLLEPLGEEMHAALAELWRTEVQPLVRGRD